MAEYILYGYVRDRSLRAITEYHIYKSGGKILFYVDDGVKEGNTMVAKSGCLETKVKVLNPESIATHPNAIVVVLVSMGYDKVISRLRNRGISNEIMMTPVLGYRFIMDGYVPPEEYAAGVSRWINDHKGRLRELYDVCDPYTGKLLEEIISQREKYSFVPPERMMEYGYEEYFSDEKVSPDGATVLVDGGAYIGDSIEQIYGIYGERFKYSIGFEPDKGNYDIAVERISGTNIRDRVLLVNKGLYSEDATLRFSLVGDEYNLCENGDIYAAVCRLDSYMDIIDEEIRGTGAQLCIKMDLEGSELNALEGAKETIGEYHPYMAICLYHKMKDILDIPDKILEYRGDYRFYLRAGTHTELYAVPQ